MLGKVYPTIEIYSIHLMQYVLMGYILPIVRRKTALTSY